MIADASRENLNSDEINMAAASTSDAKMSTTDGPSQKEGTQEETGDCDKVHHGVETPPKGMADDPGSETSMAEQPSQLPPTAILAATAAPLQPSSSTPPPTNGDVHQETSDRGVSPKDDEDEHGASSDDEQRLVISETSDKKDSTAAVAAAATAAVAVAVAAASMPLKNDATVSASVLPISSGPQQEKSGDNPPLKSPPLTLKRSVEDGEVVESVPKRPRVRDDCDFSSSSSSSDFTATQLDETISQYKTRIKNRDIAIRKKEEEWNNLIREQKKDEEHCAIFERKREVLRIKEEESKSESSPEEREGNLSPLNYQNFSHIPLMMMKHMFGGENFFNQLTQASSRPPSRHKDTSLSNGPKAPSPNSISIIDIHTNNSKSNNMNDVPQVSISPETHNKLGRHLNSMMVKPILPKPMNNMGGLPNHIGTSPLSGYPSGMGPQGPTVSVNQIIAAHRRENPNVPPINETSVLSRGAKRGAWRHKYEGEKRGSPREMDRPSSVSSSNNDTEIRLNPSINPKAHLSNSINSNNSLLAINDPSVSYKDVLLQFAQLTQNEKPPGSPQISIIPVSSSDTQSRKFEHTPDSTSVSREMSIPSQSSNQSPSLEGSSALAKLLLESGAGSHGNGAKNSAMDLSSYGSSPDSLTLSALLSGGTITTHKEKLATGSQMENRPKKNPQTDEGNSNPKCQGCQKHRAQFVCAGCSNQWYCSRSCQVTAWEHHSQNCNS